MVCLKPSSGISGQGRNADWGFRIIGIALSEQWIYERGWGKFPAVLFFVDGTLKRIDFLPPFRQCHASNERADVSGGRHAQYQLGPSTNRSCSCDGGLSRDGGNRSENAPSSPFRVLGRFGSCGADRVAGGDRLADCEYCKTDAFRTERKRIANQVGPRHDPASGMGYVVTMDQDGLLVWGRAALVERAI